MTEIFGKLFKKIIKKKNIKQGSIIKGKIIDIDHKNVIIDSGLKSESYIPIDQFKDSKGNINIKINDNVEVLVDYISGGGGETILSREKAQKYKSWLNIEKSYKKSTIIKGIINGKVKGGLTVDINGIKAFLPGSLIDIKPIKDLTNLEEKELEFKIIKLDKNNNNIVISRKAVILSENNFEREKLIKNIYEGLILEGIVKNITDYGAFIDLGGLDGLLHITDIAWKRVKHPNEILKIGEKINVKIIKFDKKNTRVSLGLKQLSEDPWKNINNKYPLKSKIKGIITNLTDYGCFIEIEEGIEGLAHISEIDWKNKNINPFKIFSIGSYIEAIILNIDQEKRRISLGIKQCKPNPWKKFIKNYNKGDTIKGTIKSITDFGIFINLDKNINGLVHTSDISWNTLNNNKNIYQKGDKIKTCILQIDTEKERISLGIKQLSEDPINKYSEFQKKNLLLKVKIIKFKKNNIKILTDEGIVGYVKYNDKIKNKFKINDLITTKIINIDFKNRLLYLHIYNQDRYTQNKKKINDNNCFNTMLEAFKIAKIK